MILEKGCDVKYSNHCVLNGYYNCVVCYKAITITFLGLKIVFLSICLQKCNSLINSSLSIDINKPLRSQLHQIICKLRVAMSIVYIRYLYKDGSEFLRTLYFDSLRQSPASCHTICGSLIPFETKLSEVKFNLTLFRI